MQESVKQDRDKYIGGSDIPIIMNLSPFKSRHDLLLEKAGYKDDDFEGNVYTEYGNTLEPFIRDWINTSYKNNKFVEGKHTREAVGGELIGVRIHTDGENSDTILEIKTTSNIYSSVYDYKLYLVQLLYYMVLTDKQKGILAVYERPEDLNTEFISNRLQLFYIARGDEKIEALIEEINHAIELFLEDLAKVKENPFITESELLPAEIPDITDRILAFESQLEYLKKFEKTVKEEKERLKKAASVKSWNTPNGYKITLVDDAPDTTKKVFDEDTFKKDNPDLYDKYQKDKLVKGKSGYILITAPKEGG